MSRTRRRGWHFWVLLAVLVVVPLVEIYLLIQIGQVIGVGWTIVLLLLDSVLGSWLIKREGGRAWTALREAINSGRMPARELADGALVLIGGTLMLAPGFVTDAFGILMILPFTRPVFRTVLTNVVAGRLVGLGVPGTPGHPGSGSGPAARRPGPGPEGPVIRGEVVDEDPRA